MGAEALEAAFRRAGPESPPLLLETAAGALTASLAVLAARWLGPALRSTRRMWSLRTCGKRSRNPRGHEVRNSSVI